MSNKGQTRFLGFRVFVQQKETTSWHFLLFLKVCSNYLKDFHPNVFFCKWLRLYSLELLRSFLVFAFSKFAPCLLAQTVSNMRGMLCVVTSSVTHLQRPRLKRICSTAPLCVNIFPAYTFTMWSCFSCFLLVILSWSFSHRESSPKTMTAFTFHLLQSDRLTWWINGLYMSLLCVLRSLTLGS